MPYITASIIMQLLGVVIPKLEQWQQEGQTGQKKITQWTRYLTVALALVQSTGFVFALHQGQGGLIGLGANLPAGIDFIPGFNFWRAGLIVLVWTAGTALVMWLAELITHVITSYSIHYTKLYDPDRSTLARKTRYHRSKNKD